MCHMDICKKNAKSVEQIKQEYEQAVDPGLVVFIQNVRSAKKAAADKLDYAVSGISEKQKADIESLTGELLSAKYNFIKGGTINHIENRHGVDGEADRSMADIHDVARIGFILHNYDEVDFLRNEKGEIIKSGSHTARNGKAAPILIYVKKINGFYSVVEAINDGKRRRLDIITAYKSRKNPLK